MKVAIIGAGIAGIYLSWKLSQKGEKVVIFEKRGVVGKEACSGLFSERILEFIPQSKILAKNRIDFCLLHFKKKTIKINFSKKFFVMDHRALDNLTLNLAEKEGVKVIKSVNLTKEDILINLPEEFDRVIGTDGANSIVRKSLNLKEPYFRLGIQGFTSEKNNRNFVDAWSTEKGFLWRIPKINETEWGILEEPERAKEIFDIFLQEKGIHLERIRSTFVPQGLILPKNEKITLCGDSAGMTKPWSGGGVAWNLVGANILLKNFPDFIKYRNEARNFFLPKIYIAKTAVNLSYFLGYKIPYLIPNNLKIESDFLI